MTDHDSQLDAVFAECSGSELCRQTYARFNEPIRALRRLVYQLDVGPRDARSLSVDVLDLVGRLDRIAAEHLRDVADKERGEKG